MNSYDALFQSTARSSRACTVYLTQNLPSYFAAFSGPNSRSEVEAFVGNLQTKIFHANGDPTTNNWAADSIGKTLQIRLSAGLSEGIARAGSTQNAGASHMIEFLVQPQEFTMLRTGGPDFEMQVDGIIFQAGRRWTVPGRDKTDTRSFIRHVFPQNYPREAP